VEVLGERGVFFWDWRNVYLWKTMSPWERSGYRDLQPVTFPYPPLFAPDLYPGITGGIQSVIDCMEQGGEPRCSGDDMRKVLEIAIALRESHRRGHVPVRLPIADRTQKIIPSPYRWLGGQPIEGQ
jgi:predicted dehydrogenase